MMTINIFGKKKKTGQKPDRKSFQKGRGRRTRKVTIVKERKISEGNYGEAHFAKRNTIFGEKTYVVKTAKMTENGKNTMAKEAEILSELPRHPNIIKKVNSDNNSDMLVMERGYTTLWDMMPTLEVIVDPAQKEKVALTLVKDMVSAFQHLQENGICHNDPHADNWLLGRDGSLKLIDFGNAVKVAPDAPGAPISTLHPIYDKTHHPAAVIRGLLDMAGISETENGKKVLAALEKIEHHDNVRRNSQDSTYQHEAGQKIGECLSKLGESLSAISLDKRKMKKTFHATEKKQKQYNRDLSSACKNVGITTAFDLNELKIQKGQLEYKQLIDQNITKDEKEKLKTIDGFLKKYGLLSSPYKKHTKETSSNPHKMTDPMMPPPAKPIPQQQPQAQHWQGPVQYFAPVLPPTLTDILQNGLEKDFPHKSDIIKNCADIHDKVNTFIGEVKDINASHYTATIMEDIAAGLGADKNAHNVFKNVYSHHVNYAHCYNPKYKAQYEAFKQAIQQMERICNKVKNASDPTGAATFQQIAATVKLYSQ